MSLILSDSTQVLTLRFLRRAWTDFSCCLPDDSSCGVILWRLFPCGLDLVSIVVVLISCVSCRIGSKKNDPCQYSPAEPNLAKFPRSREFLIPNGSQNADQKQKEFPNWGSNLGCADAYPRRKLLTPSNTGINITTSFINSSPAGHMTRSDSDSMSDR